MDRVNIAPGLDFSRIAYGMWRVGDDPDTSPERVTSKIRAALDQGITTFDQADIYGDYGAEAIMGAALKSDPGLRPKMEIVTKCGIVAPAGRYASAACKRYDTGADHVAKSVDASLSEMGIDVIDLLLIHRPDPLMDHRETGAALDKAIADGKVRAVGVSNFRPWDWDLLQSATTARLATNQIEISLAEISTFSNGDLAFHQKTGAPVMAWSPLGGGSLMGRTSSDGTPDTAPNPNPGGAPAAARVAEVADEMAASFGVDRAAIALAFLLRHPAQIVPVAGTNDPARIARLSDALKVDLDRESWFRLYEAALGTEVP